MRESKEVRAERDLWSLLDVLTRSNLIRDLDDEGKRGMEGSKCKKHHQILRHIIHMFSTSLKSSDCEKSLSLGLSVLSVRSGAAEVINAAYQSDDRIKKGGKEFITTPLLSLNTDSSQIG